MASKGLFLRAASYLRQHGVPVSNTKAKSAYQVFSNGIGALVQNPFRPSSIRRFHSNPMFNNPSVMQRLHSARSRANSFPNDASAQFQYYRVLNELGQYSNVVRRFESNLFSSNGAILEEYRRALHALGRSGSQTAASATAPAAVSESALTALPKGPVVVKMLDPSPTDQMWSFVKSAAFILLVLTGLSVILDPGRLQSSILGSPDKFIPVTGVKEKFENVEGIEEAKAELLELVEYLRNPDKFTRLGGKLPRGVLLTGPSGVGKTLLARAVAGEAGVPFFFCSGSEFDELYVGMGSRRIRQLFRDAKQESPCIIFIDEIDAVGSTRVAKDTQYMKQTLNQLLVEMDGFQTNEGVIVIGATNFPELLDKALVRPGRFDRRVHIPNPDVGGREKILKLHMKSIPKDDDVNLNILARGTPGFSGADLANLVNAAALQACLEDAPVVAMRHLEYAKDKILMGAERKSAVIEEECLKNTAYHEGGHALVASLNKHAHPVHKATIVPRGQALGLVMQLPSEDETSVTRAELMARLEVCMGGRVAEELIFGEGHVTTGASSDLQQATRLARAMVTKFGMSGIGHVVHKEGDMERSSSVHYEIEREIVKLTNEAYENAKKLLKDNEKSLHLIAEALLKYETLTGEELKALLEGKPIKENVESLPLAPATLPPAVGDDLTPQETV